MPVAVDLVCYNIDSLVEGQGQPLTMTCNLSLCHIVSVIGVYKQTVKIDRYSYVGVSHLYIRSYATNAKQRFNNSPTLVQTQQCQVKPTLTNKSNKQTQNILYIITVYTYIVLHTLSWQVIKTRVAVDN